MARWLITAGIILIAMGLIYHLAPWLINWSGKLPGDISIETERSKIFIPVASLILLSIIITILINFFRR
ncbi:MAG TPA: DUF2905 domain-containing protein [Deltaproteobacteria bacterium]|nr:DUF2905 domain-containing protein [Deltaproteobacteria bacterium]